MGLSPAFGTGYRQEFDVKVGVEKADGNRLEGVGEEGPSPTPSSYRPAGAATG